MDIVTVIDYLKKILKTRQDQVNQVITGDVKTFEEYKFLLGKIHAYNEIRQELTDLLHKQELYEDEKIDITKE
jgi:hypothetical protein|tara:strand:- start:213 stop:431 length:219 start_codon:yes stop_codon:yes gene_type:complete